MAQYIPHSIFHLARLLSVRPETFGPYYVHHKLIGFYNRDEKSLLRGTGSLNKAVCPSSLKG